MPSVTHGSAPEVDLAVRAEQALGPDHRDRVVEDLRVGRVALRQAEDHVEVVLTGEVGDVVGGRAGHGLRQFQVELARGRLRPARVAAGGADERLLAERDDVDALRRGFHHVRLDLGEGLLRVTPDRREVHDAERHDLLELLVVARNHSLPPTRRRRPAAW